MKIQPLNFAIITLSLTCLVQCAFGQGSLTPPGAPAPTMKSLDQIEPRTPISVLPFIITNSGAYYLTATLTGASGSTGLTVSTNQVTIDLQGFSLIGVAGSLEGIRLSGAITNLTVYNGTIRNWGAGVGAASSHACSYQGLHVQNNGNVGISGGAVTVVKDCVVEGNLVYGISVGENSLVSGCNVRTNANGIGVANGSVLISCSSVANAGYGVYANSGVTIQTCAARNNGGIGIVAQDGSSVTGCTASQNGNYGIWVNGGVSSGGSTVSGCSATANLDHGIYVSASGSRIVDNVCSYNGTKSAAGIQIDGGGNRIEGNHLVGNLNRGLKVTVPGNFIVRNSASLNAVNYDITGAQTMGPYVSGPGIITTNNPWANFEF